MRNRIVLAAVLMLAAASAQAQTPTSVWDGAYSDAQAGQGAAKYLAHCSMCHGLTLAGNYTAPPLTGRFIPDWAGTTLDQLFDKIGTTMPLNAPGSLSPADDADILAYILKSNGFPAGTAALAPGDGLKTIRFEATKPATPPAAPSRKAR